MRDIPLSAIEDAARAIYDPVVRTPIVRLDVPARAESRLDGSEIFLKLETLQPIGSFKIRGAGRRPRGAPGRRLRLTHGRK